MYVCRRMMFFAQRDQNFSVRSTDCGTVAERQIEGFRRNTDVVDDQRQLFFGNRVANFVFDRAEFAFSFFDASPCRRDHMQAELAGIDGRKEIFADHRQ